MGWEDWAYSDVPLEDVPPGYTEQDAYYDGLVDYPESPPPKNEKVDHGEYASRVRLYGKWNADKWLAKQRDALRG